MSGQSGVSTQSGQSASTTASAVDVDDGLTDSARRILSGLTGRDFDCQTGGVVHTPSVLSWHGDRRADSKTAIFGFVRRRPDGVPLSQVVRQTFVGSPVQSAGADYKLARRFVEDCDYIRTTRRDGYLWVEPEPEAFSDLNLSPQYVNRKTSGLRGDGLSNGSDSGLTARRGDSRADCPTDIGLDDSQQYPKDRAQAVLSNRLILDGRNEWRDCRDELLRELGTEREVQQDKFKILRRVRGQGSDHLLMPYTTRFNSADRAESIRDGFTTALETAANRHTDAVVMTLTTDPHRHSDLSEALQALSENKNRLLSWLATEYQLGTRPDNLTALEFTESGLPHVHVVLFGISWAVGQSELAAKWDDLGQGAVVDIRSTEAERGGDRWFLHNDDGGRVTLRQYLGKAIDGLCRVADMDAGQLREAAEAGDIELWRQALYWATERQYYSCSPSLKDTDSGGLPHIKRYEFVGVSQYRGIPAHVRNSARVFADRGRPPPG